MKKIINGKLYDTETAEFVKDIPFRKRNPTHEALRNQRFVVGSFKKLYRDNTGDYFMHLEHEYIVPFSAEDAKYWLKSFGLDDGEYIAESKKSK